MTNTTRVTYDRDGMAHYIVPDFQGNTAMDIDALCNVVQETYYYPYGEPWSQPQGQPWLFGGKERERRHRLGDSDFGARTYNAARATFAQPDPLAEKFYPINPYTFCAADPINHIDPSGTYIVDNSQDDWAMQRAEIERMRDEYRESVHELTGHRNLINRLNECIESLNETLNTMTKLENSPQGYALSIGYNNGFISFDPLTKLITLTYDNTSNFIHELIHAGQFENGELAFSSVNGDPMFYDIIDEMAAYKAQYGYKPADIQCIGGGVFLESINDITTEWICNISLKDGTKPYAPGINVFMGLRYVSVSSTNRQMQSSYPWMQIPLGKYSEDKYIKSTPCYRRSSVYYNKPWIN